MMRAQLKRECEVDDDPGADVTERKPAEIADCIAGVDKKPLRLFFSDQYLAEGELSNEEYLIQKYEDRERKKLLA